MAMKSGKSGATIEMIQTNEERLPRAQGSYQYINIFRGIAQYINGFIQMIFIVRPRAQGARESQEFSPWRYL